MIPELNILPDAIDWIVHPLAGVALAHFASVIFSRQGKQTATVARAAGIIALLAVLGASWVVHPAAGMLLGYFGSRAFDRRWPSYWPALLVALLAGLAFMVLGAGWLVYPLVIMGIMWLFGFLSYAWAPSTGLLRTMIGGATPAALPQQAGGLPLGSFEAAAELEPVPVGSVSTALPSKAAPAVSDPFTALQLDSRLPGDIRAQLVALDLRTREALTHLKAQGQGGSEAEYLARSIREEYAPASVNAYLKLPRTRADVAIIQDGKTGRDLLREQLDILLGAVQDILDGTVRTGGQELLTHQRFVEDKFRKVKSDLDV